MEISNLIHLFDLMELYMGPLAGIEPAALRFHCRGSIVRNCPWLILINVFQTLINNS